MMYYYSASWILLLVLLSFSSASAEIFGSQSQLPSVGRDVYYAVEFTDSIMCCPDFDNKNLKADTMELGLTPGEEDEPDIFGLNGDLEVLIPLDTDHEIQLEVCKETEVTCEPMLSAQTSLCESMQETDAPWFPVFTMMNVSSCPIPEGSYPIKNLMLSMEPFKSCLSREFCGYYAVQLAIMNKLDMLSCHMAYIEIVEKQSE